MKGLLLKDFYVMKKQFLIIFALLLFFSVMGSTLGLFYAGIFAAMLPLSTIAFDERSKWEKLAAAMPYSNAQLVWSKYLFFCLTMAASVLVWLALQPIAAAVKLAALPNNAAVTALFVVTGALFMVALLLPAVFKLGVEKARLLSLIVVFAGVFAFVMLVMHASSEQVNMVESLAVSVSTAWLLLAAASVAFVLSGVLSTHIYAQKEK